MDQNREMYEEINALVAAIAKGLELSEEETVRALEGGKIAVATGGDENGRFVTASYGEKKLRVYQGAIRHEAEEEAEPADGCGDGCGCGH